MSEDGEPRCPICNISELTAATKVYPLCQCKLSICFDCLKRWAEIKYCCPFCNIHFTSDALHQTKEDLMIRLRGKVDDSMLEEVVDDWVELLQLLCNGMDVGLVLLNMESADGSDIELPDLFAPTLERARTPFFPNDWPFRRTSSMLSRSNFGSLRQPNLSTTSSFMIPTLSSYTSIPYSIFDRQGTEINTLPTQHGTLHSTHSNLIRSSQRNSGLNLYRSSKTDNLGLHTEISQGIPTANTHSRYQLIKANMLAKDSSSRLSNFSNNSENHSKRLGEFMRNHSERVKSVLSKKLHVRELVKIRPGSDVERQLEGNHNRVGVLMKHSGKFRVGPADEVIMEQDMLLTVRLRDGSWLYNVRVEDVESLGKRATLTEYLRIGDILLTRFGVAVARQLHPSSAQVTVEFRGEFVDPKKFSLRERNEIHAELRRVLNDDTDEKEDEHVLTTSYRKISYSNVSNLEETKDEPIPRSASLATNLLDIKEEGFLKVDLTDPEPIIMRNSDSDSNRPTSNIDIGETKSRGQRTLRDYNRSSKDGSKNQEDWWSLNPDIPSIYQSNSRNSNPQIEIKEKIGAPDAFEQNSPVLTAAHIASLSRLPSLPECAYFAEHVEKSESIVPPKLDVKPSISDQVNIVREKINPISKIHDTDIQTVFSAAEVFDRIEKKVVQDFLATANAQNLQNLRSSVGFKNEPRVSENLKEDNEILQRMSGNMSSLSYNDRVISPHSDRSSKPGINVNFGFDSNNATRNEQPRNKDPSE